MVIKNRFWWFAGGTIVIIVIIISGLAVFSWRHLSPLEQEILLGIAKRNFVYIFSAFILLMAGLGSALDGIFHLYILPMGKLIEETELINSVNASHRIHIEGSKNIVRLAGMINEGADQIETLQRSIGEKIQMARAETESEKNILAAIMSELPEGILICNRDGQILLYNKRAREFLATGAARQEEAAGMASKPAVEPDNAFIGLGRSVFGVIDKNLVVHALDEITDKLDRQDKNVMSSFVAVGKAENLLRVEAVPILDPAQRFSGFILIFYDITRQLETDHRVSFLLQSLTLGIRNALTGIRTAIETIIDYPDIDPATRQEFSQIISRGARSIADDLDSIAIAYSDHFKSRWPLIQMSAADLLESIRTNAENKLGLLLNVRETNENYWIKVDSYSLILAVLFVLYQLKMKTGSRAYTARLERKGDVIGIDLFWQGRPIRIETLREWDDKVLMVKQEGISFTLKEVLGHHGAEIWSFGSRKKAERAHLRIFLPAHTAGEHVPVKKPAILPPSRPEFYDFDLFNQPGQRPELDNRLLRELSYTVFDTETTGLDPRGGDEIISIGAVRILNRRILREEVFDRLVHPRRPVPAESVKIHGIDPQLLKTKPTIDKILPLFHGFAEDTILVAHNAAFDMRMLQLKEEATGIRFINPVLDTLLLSAVVHPAHRQHNLEMVAKRLGIRIFGRHTALGDAMATGEIFLKLIPLLEKKGIRTLQQARSASRKTYYARLRY